MRRQISIKWGTLGVILSILMLAPVLAQSKEKGKSQDDIYRNLSQATSMCCQSIGSSGQGQRFLVL